MVLLLALGIADCGVVEGILALRRPLASSEHEPATPQPWRPDDVLGYPPLANHHWLHRRRRGSMVLFDAEATTGPGGW